MLPSNASADEIAQGTHRNLGRCLAECGRVAQSAERVCEQHETVVRNHSPAANSLRRLVIADTRDERRGLCIVAAFLGRHFELFDEFS